MAWIRRKLCTIVAATIISDGRVLMRRAFMIAVLAATTVVALAGCPAPDRTAAPVAVGWQEGALPAVDGRFALGDVAACGGRWYVVGGVYAAGGGTRPAAWSTVDGRRWAVLATHPVSAYGQRHLFYSAACASGRLVVIGAASGGAHGNNRTATWVADLPDGPLVEVDASFELYGGPNAGGVNRVSAASAGLVGTRTGFVIAGNRVGANGRGGAAVWTSPDGTAFTLHDADPALQSDAAGITFGAEASAVGGGWVLVGSLWPPGTPDAARDPLAWASTDGTHWRREHLPASSTVDESLDRVTPLGGGSLAVGPRGGHFGAWLRDPGGTWRAGGDFGSLGGAAVPLVTGVTTVGGTAFVAGCDGRAYRLWATADGMAWRAVGVPVELPAGAQRKWLVAAAGDRLLFAADDATRVRLWTATPAKPR
jgi:hypothetical protein